MIAVEQTIQWSVPTVGSAPRVTVLVGAPGSGKSTWTKAYQTASPREAAVISTDDLIEEYGAEHGLNYTEAFDKLRDVDLTKVALAKFRVALAERRDVIVDRTNMRVKSRNRFLSQVPKHYLRVAVVFNVPEDVLLKRIKARAEATGKHIPYSVFRDMVDTYQMPTLDEVDVLEVLS